MSISTSFTVTLFQSTPPARGGDQGHGGDRDAGAISIHAPREGGDNPLNLQELLNSISIHAPREGGDSKDAQFYLWIFDK